MAGYSKAEMAMSGGEKPPKKEIKHIETSKSDTKGDHIHVHHHTRPDHHPPETHTTRGDDEMTAHMLQNIGTANPGEATDPNAAPEGAPAGAIGTPPAGAIPSGIPSPAGAGV